MLTGDKSVSDLRLVICEVTYCNICRTSQLSKLRGVLRQWPAAERGLLTLGFEIVSPLLPENNIFPCQVCACNVTQTVQHSK